MTALTVTASLDQPIIGLIDNPGRLPLDGPLAWAAAVAGGLPPITPDHAPDVDLPLARWEEAGAWGWCASSARYEVERWISVDLRRRPATAAMARYTTVGKHHLGLGPHKARNVIYEAAWVRTIRWDVDCTDRERLASLLDRITHLGSHTAIGYGHVAAWTIEPAVGPDGWRKRPMPTPGATVAVRPPYWHPSRRITCPT